MDFCVSCTALDISLGSFITHPGTDDNHRLKDPIRSIGRLNEIRNRYKTCALCRLIFAVFRSGPFTRLTGITDLSNVAVFAKWINALGPSKAERLKSCSISILVWAEAPHVPSGLYKVIIRAVSDILPTQPFFGRLSPVAASLLDFGQIKSWLKGCEGSHIACAPTSSVKPTKHFFVIDTRFMCIIEPHDTCRYLALSYVWGAVDQYMLSEDNIEKLKKSFSIQPRHLTATIRDAIVLTKQLGERYLWVDTLCIIQDSKSVRQQTLRDMGSIYAQSLLTIVAGSCSSANDSLPGVTEQRIWIQWHQKVSNSLAISAHFDFKDLLERTTYQSRAWT
jgi:hypothetical protein